MAPANRIITLWVHPFVPLDYFDRSIRTQVTHSDIEKTTLIKYVQMEENHLSLLCQNSVQNNVIII